jgi:hypothetical protein
MQLEMPREVLIDGNRAWSSHRSLLKFDWLQGKWGQRPQSPRLLKSMDLSCPALFVMAWEDNLA